MTWRAVIGVAVILASGMAGAAESDDLTCRAEEAYLANMPARLEKQWLQPDWSCLVPVERMDVQPGLLVDIRPESAWKRVHIPKSMNMPLAKVLNDPMLKQRPVYLVMDGGPRDEALLCGRLRLRGLQQAYVVAGGLRAWLGAGRQLTGQAGEVADTHFIPADRFPAFWYQPGMTWVMDRASWMTIRKSAGQPASGELIIVDNTAGLAEAVNARLNKQGTSPHPERQRIVLLAQEPDYLRYIYQAWQRNRYVFGVSDSPVRVSEAFTMSRMIAEKYKEVPDRYKCGGRS